MGPDVVTDAPDVVTDAPDVVTEAPDVVTGAPEVTEAPDVVTEAPDTTVALDENGYSCKCIAALNSWQDLCEDTECASGSVATSVVGVFVVSALAIVQSLL